MFLSPVRSITLVLALFGALVAGPAAAATLQFRADISDPFVTGSITGVLEARDQNGDGRAGVGEIISFAFAAEFSDEVLDFSGNHTTHRVRALPASGALPSLTEGFDIGALRVFGRDPDAGVFNLLALTAERVLAVQFGPDGFGVAVGRPSFLPVIAAAPVTVISLPGTLGLLLPALLVLGFLAINRPGPRKRIKALLPEAFKLGQRAYML